MVPIFVPQAVHSRIGLGATHEQGVLRFVLRADEDWTRRNRCTAVFAQFMNDVRRRSVDERLCRVETKTVEAHLQPVADVFAHEVPHGGGTPSRLNPWPHSVACSAK